MNRVVVSIVSAVTFFSIYAAAVPYTVLAQTGANPAHCGKESAGFLGFPTWYKFLNPSVEDPDGAAGPIPPSCDINFEFTPAKIGAVLIALFEIILRLSAIIAIIFVIWGGIQLQLSQGEPDRFSNARSTIINALIGLVITISAVAIVNFVGNNLR